MGRLQQVEDNVKITHAIFLSQFSYVKGKGHGLNKLP